MKSKIKKISVPKIKKENLLFLLCIYFIKIIVLMVFLSDEYHISPYYNTYKFINILNIEFCCDIIYFLIMFFLSEFQIKCKNIFGIYKKDINYKMQKYFIIPEIIKDVFLVKTIGNSIFYYNYKVLFGGFIIVVLLYYILTFFIFSEWKTVFKFERVKKEIRRFKRKNSRLKSSYNFILIKGKIVPSSFEIEKIQTYEIDKSHIYINQEEFDSLQEKEKLFIIKNLIAIIYEDENSQLIDKILLEKQEKIGYYKIIATSSKNEYEKTLNKIQHISYIKICNIESTIEFTENLLMVSSDVMVNQFQYKLMEFLIKIELINNESYKYLKSGNKIKEIIDIKSLNKQPLKKIFNSYIKENLNIICQQRFNDRFKNEILEIPQDKFLRELYQNAYTNSSPYQSSMILFNYITAIGRIVECYLISTYREKDINLDKYINTLAQDGASIWRGQINLNIYNNPKNHLYSFLREKELKLSYNEEIILKLCLASVLNCEIQGNCITFDVLSELYQEFRNKVEAHGIISDDNVYIVWNIAMFFVNMFNRFFDISNLILDYDLPYSKIMAGYCNEKKASLGINIIIKNNLLYFIRDKKKAEKENKEKLLYFNYFNGKEEVEYYEEI